MDERDTGRAAYVQKFTAWALALTLPLLAGRARVDHGHGPEQPCPVPPALTPNSADNRLGSTGTYEIPRGLNYGLSLYGETWDPALLEETPFDVMDQDDAVRPLLEAVTSASFDSSLGQDLQEVAAGFDAELWDTYGLALLTDEEQQELCESPFLDATLTDDGSELEARLALWGSSIMAGDVQRLTWTDFPPICEEALVAAAGDIDGAACHANVEASFFPDGSDCRACLEESAGDATGCTDDGRCEAHPDYMLCVWEDSEDLDTFACHTAARGWFIGCAPGQGTSYFLLYTLAEGQTAPRLFYNDDWEGLFYYTWNDSADSMNEYAYLGDTPLRTTLGAGVMGIVEHIRPVGSSGSPWQNRLFFVSSIDTDDLQLTSFWGFSPGFGPLSAASELEDTDGDGSVGPGDDNFGFPYGGFDLAPHETRPDGELKARDYVAGWVLKTSTQRNGALISVYNHSRCVEERWIGPDADGAYRCSELGPPVEGWLNDGEIAFYETEDGGRGAVPYAMATIASTGLPDPVVPAAWSSISLVRRPWRIPPGRPAATATTSSPTSPPSIRACRAWTPEASPGTSTASARTTPAFAWC